VYNIYRGSSFENTAKPKYINIKEYTPAAPKPAGELPIIEMETDQITFVGVNRVRL
jgi:hypothetical protein